MCMTIFLILWQSIEHRYTATRKETSHTTSNLGHLAISEHCSPAEIHEVNHFTVNCSKSTTGLFFGILVLLITLISLITYFIYKEHDPEMAVKLSEFIELFLLILSLTMVLSIYLKLKCYKFSHKHERSLSYNAILIIIGLGGIYAYGFYSIIALLDNGKESSSENLSLSIHIVSIVESTLQSVLIINSLNMYTKDRVNKKEKPARSFITLLILIDVSLWLTETFSVKKYDMSTVQLDYYNIVFWSITSSIATPLAIFFRFHASVCLSDIWKIIYE